MNTINVAFLEPLTAFFLLELLSKLKSTIQKKAAKHTRLIVDLFRVAKIAAIKLSLEVTPMSCPFYIIANRYYTLKKNRDLITNNRIVLMQRTSLQEWHYLI